MGQMPARFCTVPGRPTCRCKVELVINLKIGKALGLTVPLTLQAATRSLSKRELCCDCSQPLLALSDQSGMSAFWSLSGEKQTWPGWSEIDAIDPWATSVAPPMSVHR